MCKTEVNPNWTYCEMRLDDLSVYSASINVTMGVTDHVN